VPNVKKIRGLNLPDLHGPVQACSGAAFFFVTLFVINLETNTSPFVCMYSILSYASKSYRTSCEEGDSAYCFRLNVLCPFHNNLGKWTQMHDQQLINFGWLTRKHVEVSVLEES
jgi:hypothetical protein